MFIHYKVNKYLCRAPIINNVAYFRFNVTDRHYLFMYAFKCSFMLSLFFVLCVLKYLKPDNSYFRSIINQFNSTVVS